MTHLAPSPAGPIFTGVGGWTFEPWRDNFYPKGLPHSQELAWASRRLTAIEVNGTYYSTFKPETFARWHDETPAGFRFALKANRFITTRRVLATAGEGIERFVGSGIAALGDKLGPIVWQFMPTKVFDAVDFEAFLQLLPAQAQGRPLRHVLDVRHPSFMDPAFLPLARRYGCATVHTDSDKYPSIVDAESAIAYLRLMRCDSALDTGYPPAALDLWAAGARAWTAAAPGPPGREAWVFFINGAKERAPAAAQELLRRLA